jgi:hypothetical protein
MVGCAGSQGMPEAREPSLYPLQALEDALTIVSNRSTRRIIYHDKFSIVGL